LSSRQWRALQGALALRQEDRLGSIAALRSGLFESSSWPLRLLVSGFCVAALAIAGVYFFKENEIQEVQQKATEAATTEERIDRLVELVREPVFDAAWEQQIAAELERVNELANATHLQLQARTQIATLYENQIKATADLEGARSLLERGRAYGAMASARRDLEARLHARLSALLDAPSSDPQWVESVTESLARLPIRTHLGALAAVEVNSLYLKLLDDFAVQGALSPGPDTVDALVGHLQSHEFDQDALALAQAKLAAKSSAVQAAERAAAARAVAAQEVVEFATDIAPLGCMVAELPELRAEYSRLRATPGVNRLNLRRQLDTALYDCVLQLQPVEPDAAADLLTESLKSFGALPQLSTVRIDPCDRQYLVGAGATKGRGGYCVDRLKNDDEAPQMVVIPASVEPGGAPKFAISKYEISWREYGAFCTASAMPDCAAAASTVVHTASIDQARAFGDWISESSGYTYRLPTLAEYTRAMAQDQSSSSNCKVELGGIVRGGRALAQTTGTASSLGLVNGFGNLQEWVEDETAIYAVGGHFDDPLDRCELANQRPVNGAPDGLTGFRLVREITPRAAAARAVTASTTAKPVGR